MVGGTPGHFRIHTLKTQLVQIQLIDKYVNDPNRVILSDVVVEMLGKQCALRTIFAFDKSLHQSLPLLQRVASKLPKLSAFSHSLDSKRTWKSNRREW